MTVDPTVGSILATLITTLGSVYVAYAQNRPPKPKKRPRKPTGKQTSKQQSKS